MLGGMMLGGMMCWPLPVGDLIRNAPGRHGETRIAGRETVPPVAPIVNAKV